MRGSVLLTILSVLAIGTMMLAACGPLGGSGEAKLVGPVWTLTALNGQPPLPVTAITAEFGADGRVSGSSGCNNYSGPYEVDGDKLSFGERMVSTLMACQPVVMDQEAAYMEALQSVASYEITGSKLTLYDSGSRAVAEFEVVKQGLEGTSWDVIAYNNGKGGVTSVIIGTEITADFGASGQLTGSAGCNNYVAEYKTDGNKISISSAVATTRKACQEEGVMEQENAYLAALETADVYKVEGASMEMRTKDGAKVAGFQRASAQGSGASGDALSPDALANMAYSSEFTQSGTAPLENGAYSEQAAPGSATETKVMLTDFVAMGELNGQPAAAVVLVTDPGGSGTFYTLHVVMEENGQPVDVASTLLGDRAQINSVSIENNQIVVDMVTHGPEDPMCCPSSHVVKTYELQNGQLVETSSTEAGSGQGAAVTGVVTYRQRIALPEDAVVQVQLRDVSLMDVASQLIGEEVIHTNGKQVPFPYTVAYDPKEIDERNTYSMSAGIEDGSGKLLWISDTATPVITHGNPTQDVEIVVAQVGSP